MATTFERVCKSVWEEMSDGPLKTKAVTFLAKYEPIVSLFCDRVDLQAVVENMADLGKVPDEAMRVIASGPLCVSLFRGPYEKAARKLLQADMHKQIRELFHNNFESSDVEVVKNRMEENLKTFEARTNVGKTKTVFRVTFSGATIKLEAKHAEPEFKKLLSAELKSVGIANGQLTRTVWEQMVWGKGPIATVLSHVMVPEKYLTNAAAARSAVHDFFGTGFYTMEQFKRDLLNREKHLLMLDPDFDFEISFVKEHMESILVKQLQNLTLAELPTGEHAMCLKKVAP